MRGPRSNCRSMASDFQPKECMGHLLYFGLLGLRGSFSPVILSKFPALSEHTVFGSHFLGVNCAMFFAHLLPASIAATIQDYCLFYEVFNFVEKVYQAGLMALPVLVVFNMPSLWIFYRAFWGAASVSRSGIRNGPFHSSNAVLHYI